MEIIDELFLEISNKMDFGIDIYFSNTSTNAHTSTEFFQLLNNVEFIRTGVTNTTIFTLDSIMLYIWQLLYRKMSTNTISIPWFLFPTNSNYNQKNLALVFNIDKDVYNQIYLRVD